MHLRTTKVKQKHGVAEFVQLVESERNPKTGVPQARVIQHLGRKDQLDIEGLKRLVKSISRFTDEQPAATQGSLFDVAGFEKSQADFEFTGARSVGAVWLLDGLWKRFGIDRILGKLLTERAFTTPIERLLFALVANRAVAPSSKLAMEDWVAKDVLVPGLPAVSSEQLYRAMDFLLTANEAIQEAVFFNVATLLNLEVDVVFLDTTSTYFEIEAEDDEDPAARMYLRQRGKSKDNHPELPQVVIGFAMTRQGIPVRCWTWPGNTGDQTILEEVKRDLNGWKLGRVVTVADAGFNSEKNRRILQQAGGHYILGERLRCGNSGEPVEALSRGGRYTTYDDGLEMKEVKVGEPGAANYRRYVVVKNPEMARRDKAKRDDIVKTVETELEKLKKFKDEDAHHKAECALRAHKTFGRFVTQTPKGRLTLNRTKIANEERCDGKFMISSSDHSLSAEDIMYGYKALWAIERTFRDMKHVLDLRPVYHRVSDRIRAHVLLCWLAMVLVRIAESETGETWSSLRSDLGRQMLGSFQCKQKEFQHISRATISQITAYKACKVAIPPLIYLETVSQEG